MNDTVMETKKSNNKNLISPLPHLLEEEVFLQKLREIELLYTRCPGPKTQEREGSWSRVSRDERREGIGQVEKFLRKFLGHLAS